MADGADDDLEDLYEHAPCGYVSMRRDGTITRVNATLVSWLGVARDEVVGRRFQDFLTTPGRIYHDTHYMPLLAMQGVAREIAFDLRRQDGSPLPTMVTTIGIRDESGRVTHYRATVFDASSRRAYEREIVRQRTAAEQEATARSALLAMLSHDVRSPLSSILMAIDLLSDNPELEQRAHYTRLIGKAANNILELVDAILEHSRLDAGAAVWDPQPTDLRALLTELVSIHAIKADHKKLELRTAIDDTVPPAILVDRYKLGQIVTNLVSNAIKFTERGHVAIELRTLRLGVTEVELELRVTDTGIGMPEEALATIFDEFKQATRATARRYGGTGLGLAISRKLAALANTTIQVESEVGRGTTFWCVLRAPLVQADASGVTSTHAT